MQAIILLFCFNCNLSLVKNTCSVPRKEGFKARLNQKIDYVYPYVAGYGDKNFSLFSSQLLYSYT